jgi:type I restriction enzyme M protein
LWWTTNGWPPSPLLCSGELDRVSQTLIGRIRQLAERYAPPLPQIVDEVEKLAAKVATHLEKMRVKA